MSGSLSRSQSRINYLLRLSIKIFFHNRYRTCRLVCLFVVFSFVFQFVHVFQLSVCAGSLWQHGYGCAFSNLFVEWRRGVQVQMAISITSLLQLKK